jgi:hypothetical protein
MISLTRRATTYCAVLCAALRDEKRRANHALDMDEKHPYQKHGYAQIQRWAWVILIPDRRLRTDVPFIRA